MISLVTASESPVRVDAVRPGPVTRRTPRRWIVRQWLKNLLDGSLTIPLVAKIARRLGLMVSFSEVHGRILHADGTVTELGLLGRRVITDAGVSYLAADMAGGANDISLFRFHGFGTGSTAEAANQTALVTELTTQYASASTRPTGSQSSSTNTYTTVATLAPSSTVTIAEHGLLSQAAVPGGTLWDRTVFTGVPLTGGADTLQVTYVATFPSGG